MDSGVSLIKALATTLLSEIDSLESDDISLEDSSFDLAERVRAFETKLIKTALIKTQGNQRRAAFLLGVKNTTLHNKIKVYGIKCLKTNNGFVDQAGLRHIVDQLQVELWKLCLLLVSISYSMFVDNLDTGSGGQIIFGSQAEGIHLKWGGSNLSMWASVAGIAFFQFLVFFTRRRIDTRDDVINSLRLLRET